MMNPTNDNNTSDRTNVSIVSSSSSSSSSSSLSSILLSSSPRRQSNNSSSTSLLSNWYTNYMEQYMDWYHPEFTTSWINLVTTTGFVSLGIYGSARIYKNYIKPYGIEGWVWYLWDGDYYPPALRTNRTTLQKAQMYQVKLTNQLTILEEGYERAKLDSMDDASTTIVYELWKFNLPKTMQDIRQRLALLNNDIEKIMILVDSVLFKKLSKSVSSSSTQQTSSRMENELRQQKKQLSHDMVVLMERLDRLILTFQNISHPNESE